MYLPINSIKIKATKLYFVTLATDLTNILSSAVNFNIDFHLLELKI